MSLDEQRNFFLPQQQIFDKVALGQCCSTLYYKLVYQYLSSIIEIFFLIIKGKHSHCKHFPLFQENEKEKTNITDNTATRNILQLVFYRSSQLKKDDTCDKFIQHEQGQERRRDLNHRTMPWQGTPELNTSLDMFQTSREKHEVTGY